MAPNEPQWGRKGNEGPPDLDELWRKFNQRLSALLGGRRGAPGGGSPIKPAGGMGVIVVLLLLVWLASGFYIVDAGERGVMLRFGKYVETTLPGPHWHLPYPIENVRVVNVDQVRTVEIGYRGSVKNKVQKEALMLTDDENIIDIQFAVQYIIKNPEDYLFNNRSPDGAVRQAAETAIRQVVGKSEMDYVLYEGRSEVAARAAKLIQEILDRYKTGISISKVTMQNAQPPEQVQAAFDDAVKAGQDKARLRNEGQAYANDVIPRAQGAAARLLEEAAGYKQRVVDRAQGDVSRFRQILVQYEKAPHVTRERMYLDAMQQILANTSKVMVDQKSGATNLLYLPLDKLIQSARRAQPDKDAAKKAAVPNKASPAAGDSTWRSREAFRSREREARP